MTYSITTGIYSFFGASYANVTMHIIVLLAVIGRRQRISPLNF